MKKLILFLFTVAAFCTAASAQKTKLYNVSENCTINIRAEANPSSRILRKWGCDDENTATFISASGNWYKVNFRGTVGYVHFRDVQATSEGYSGERAVSMSDKGYATIRKDPSKTSPVVGKMPNYGVAKYLGASGKWYKISYNGIVGYSDEVSTMW